MKVLRGMFFYGIHWCLHAIIKFSLIIAHFHAPNFTFKIKPFKISNFNR
ncbi:hypothetical protein HPNQ4200_0670 [Helicobacter pylori NQ4200]|uniref:Uncharacterized protein n=1 Tax=Helicobacter pylori NQ4200 TaxID=992024 RepID=I9Q8K5_HELPX|nr:hypothetical protein HPNQ4200_0670 [Helicobacter pylori NQ4200]